ncbi:MAG: hypothetical protein ACI9YE_000289 [Psychroserpens sp.]|jgi:hypothetical protein
MIFSGFVREIDNEVIKVLKISWQIVFYMLISPHWRLPFNYIIFWPVIYIYFARFNPTVFYRLTNS